MAVYEFKTEWLSTDTIGIEAKNEEEARVKFDEGDFAYEQNNDYQLNEIISVKLVED